MLTDVNTRVLYSYSRGDDVSPLHPLLQQRRALRTPNGPRTEAGHDSNTTAHRAGCVRSSFDFGPRTGPAKPPGLGMVSPPQHAAGCTASVFGGPESHTGSRENREADMLL
jgi:hypothetical protein